MSKTPAPEAETLEPHEHEPKPVLVLEVRAGVPYEVEQQVCEACARVLGDKPVKRATA